MFLSHQVTSRSVRAGARLHSKLQKVSVSENNRHPPQALWASVSLSRVAPSPPSVYNGSAGPGVSMKIRQGHGERSHVTTIDTSPTAHFVAPPQEHLDPPPSAYLFRWGRDHPRWSRCLRGRRRTHPPLGSLLCPHPPPLWVSEMRLLHRPRDNSSVQAVDNRSLRVLLLRDTILRIGPQTYLIVPLPSAPTTRANQKRRTSPHPPRQICAKKSSSTCLLSRRPLRPSRRALPWKTPPP